MAIPAKIRVNVRVPFPALVNGGAFVTVAKANGIWTIAPNYQLLAPAASLKPTQLLATFDTASGSWNTVTTEELASGVGTFTGLSDVNITEGPSIDGFAPTWSNASGKWVATSISGGGGGTPVVTSVGALAALAFSSGALAILNAGGRYGNFTFSTANLSTQVTADPAQGITVAPVTDTTGASGAWLRQYDGPLKFSWFGADGTSANTAAAIAAFAPLARFLSANGKQPV